MSHFLSPKLTGASKYWTAGSTVSPVPHTLLQYDLATTPLQRQSLFLRSLDSRWLLWLLEYGESDTGSDTGIALQWQLLLPASGYLLLEASLSEPSCEKPKAHGQTTDRCAGRQIQLCSQLTASITRQPHEWANLAIRWDFRDWTFDRNPMQDPKWEPPGWVQSTYKATRESSDHIKPLSFGVVGHTATAYQQAGFHSGALFPAPHQSQPSSVMGPNSPTLPTTPFPPLTTFNNCLYQSWWVGIEMPGPTFPLIYL